MPLYNLLYQLESMETFNNHSKKTCTESRLKSHIRNAMFAQLREHAVNIETDIQSLEKALDLKTKTLFSIIDSDVSDSSIQFLRKLNSDLKRMEDSMSRLVDETKNLNNKNKMEYYERRTDLKNISDEVGRMENHLKNYGYERINNRRGADYYYEEIDRTPRQRPSRHNDSY